MSEADWQRQVVELAGILGWQHLHVRRTIGRGKKWVTATNLKGFPDLLLWHETMRRIVAAELKTNKGRVQPEQLDVLRSLQAAGMETFVWRPDDLDDVKHILSWPRAA
jgi:hypothetical protein